MIPGGTLRHNSLSLVGAIAEKSLKNFYVDKLIMGVDGFDNTGLVCGSFERFLQNALVYVVSLLDAAARVNG